MPELIYYLFHIAFTAILSAEAADTVLGCNAPGTIIPSSSHLGQDCTITSMLATESTILPTGTYTFCTCGKSQYDITTFTQGKSTNLACVISGPRVSIVSVQSMIPATTSKTPSSTITSTGGIRSPSKITPATSDDSPTPSVLSTESDAHSTASLFSFSTLDSTPTTESSVQLDSKTASLTSILCATKVPSSAHAKPWGSTFKVTDASSAVARACDFESFALSRSMGEHSSDSSDFHYEELSMSKEGKDIKMLFAAAVRSNCNIMFSPELCKYVFNSMISGHPSCPEDQDWTMGGMGISDCGYFLLTGTSYDTRDPFADMHSSEDWK
ncbi:uncharacterized protein KD926_002074 [Aspergillus affinis]|uniref:uncharacterized protein n=1 Tax=Aspergillus affinis TaxID=1070780 RepID=UPI0022FF01F0|nr:uncharacterized protein KD926_002074 [Aspergillus affinis]KAI9036311.1 hypothetical protein KD926_002074 [Aspergillus affinis]